MEPALICVGSKSVFGEWVTALCLEFSVYHIEQVEIT